MIKLLGIGRNKAVQALEKTDTAAQGFYRPLGITAPDSVNVGNIAKDRLNSILGSCKKGLENINDWVDVKKGLGGFEHFRFKSGSEQKPLNYDFFGKKQDLIKYLKKNGIEYSVHKKKHGNQLIRYFLSGNGNNKYCYLAEYSHKNNRLREGFCSLGDEIVILKKNNSGRYEMNYTEYSSKFDANFHTKHTTLFIGKDMKVKESKTEIDRFCSNEYSPKDNIFRLKFDEKGFPSIKTE